MDFNMRFSGFITRELPTLPPKTNNKKQTNKKIVRDSSVCQHYLHELAKRRVISYFHRTCQVDFVGFRNQREGRIVSDW